MNAGEAEYGLEFLLAFDGRVHHLEEGYWLKFEIKRVEATKERPHGLSYSFTLHAPDGARLVGFDNAHGVPARGSRFRAAPPASDHWHRTENDPGQPYAFQDTETLIDDFFDEVERVLGERGIGRRSWAWKWDGGRNDQPQNSEPQVLARGDEGGGARGAASPGGCRQAQLQRC